MNDDIATGLAFGIAMALTFGGPVLLILIGCAINNFARGYRAKWEEGRFDD